MSFAMTIARPFRLLTVTAAALLALSGCGRNANPLLGVPLRGQVQLNVPATNGGQALSVGETSAFYEITRALSLDINSHVAWVFDIVEAIVALPPTSTEGNTAVWGPSEPEGLERLSHRFTVVDNGDGTFSYALDARLKGSTDDADFVTVFEGHATPGEDDKGTGDLTVHLGSRRALIDAPCDVVGDLQITYDAASEPRALDIVSSGVADECRGERPTDAHYLYTEAADASGTMDYAFRQNLHRLDEDKPLDEVFAVRSRWLGDGAGRSDVRISEGEVPGDLAAALPNSGAVSVDVVECWDALFGLVYAGTTPAELADAMVHPETGDSAQCSFASAEFASL